MPYCLSSARSAMATSEVRALDMKLLTTAAIWILIGVWLLGCDSANEVFEHYGSATEARDNNIVERGWLPAWLPPSATNIHVLADVDLNIAWSRFDADPGDFQSSTTNAALEPADTNQLDAIERTLPTSISWWDLSSVRDEDVDVYRARHRDRWAYVAVNHRVNRYYFWMTTRR